MDEKRAEFDLEQEQLKWLENNKKQNDNEKEIDDAIEGEISRVYDEKRGIDNNMELAKRIIDLNPELPKAFQSKFKVMSINAHFAKNVSVVIENAKKNGIDLELNKQKETQNIKLEKLGKT